MEPIYAVRSTYDEDMFYHQVVASKPRMMPKEENGKKIRFQLPDFGLKDTLMALLVGAAVYMAFGQLETSTRILQAVLCGLVAAVVLRRMNERQNGETSGKKINSISADKNQALQLLESSGLKGERCTLNFYEDTFTVERPGIITEYQYEGIAWIKETSKYYMIFWNRSLAISVEKAGFYRGKKETFGGFLEKRCNKVIEKVKNA